MIDRIYVGEFSKPKNMVELPVDFREEIETRGEFFAALTDLAEKLQQKPVGQWTIPDEAYYRYFLAQTATPGVYILGMAPADHKENDDESEVFEFDSVEGQDADEYRKLTGFVTSIANNLVMDGHVPNSLLNYYKSFQL